jgi:hypothetical protein
MVEPNDKMTAQHEWAIWTSNPTGLVGTNLEAP